MKKILNPYKGQEDKGYFCFACCPSNPYGLKMEFYEDGEDVVCYWQPRPEYQSWIGTLHGGIQCTLLDELGGWIVNRKLQVAGMTVRLNMKYGKPVPVKEGVTIELRGRIKEMKRKFAVLDTELKVDGEVLSSAEMTYCCFDKETSAEKFYFTGCEVEE